MLSRCQGAARASCSSREGELEAKGDSKAGRVCDLPNKKSGSLDSQGEDHGQGRWSGSALVQWQPCNSICDQTGPGSSQEVKSVCQVQGQDQEIFGLDTQSCNVAKVWPS